MIEIEQILISGIILAALGFFIWGRWRHDVVALTAIFAAALFGLVSFDEIFLGFVHPVVILIVAVLIISKGLVNSGAVDFAAKYFKFAKKPVYFQLGVLVAFTAFLSAFINSLGALAFVLPIAARVANQAKKPVSLFLIPLAFGSNLGGNLTVIGSFSNIIVSGLRSEQFAPFGFFEFAFVALPIAVVSIIFIAAFAKLLLPERAGIFSQSPSSQVYTTELSVPDNSPILGKTLSEFKSSLKENFKILALVREGEYVADPSSSDVIKRGDVLTLETQLSSLEAVLTRAKLEFLWGEPPKNFETAQVVVSESSYLRGESAKSLGLISNYHVDLLAFSRPGALTSVKKRLADVKFRAGDIIIVQGPSEKVSQFVRFFDLLALQEREFHFEGEKEKAVLASGIFLVAILISAFGLFPIHLVFALAALAIIVAGFIPAKNMYDSVDFSMIVLVAVMLQLGNVFSQTGAANSLAETLFLFKNLSPELVLAALFAASILLAAILSNVTVAVLLAPMALALAQNLGASADPFLMAVAIGAGSSYLIPTGHQSNIFVMGLGGYKFSDYWRLGLPLEIITFVIGILLIPYFWPF